ncbi:MAG: DUF1015 family protein [Acidobacteriota bacterium]
MVQLRPFRALRPAPDLASEVASVPYDVVSSEEARSLAEGNPRSFLRVVRPEIEFPPASEASPEEIHRAGARALARLVEAGALQQDGKEALYLYRLTWRGHHQTGVVGCCAVDDYDFGAIKKHEFTRPDKERDRTNHGLAVRAHVGPVFLTYRGRPEIAALVAAGVAGEALYDFTSDDGVRHQVWRVADGSDLVRAFAAVPALYVADGHHRTACASRIRGELTRANAGHHGGEDYNFFLAVMFPAEELRILPYHRWVADLAGRDADAFLAALSERYTVTENASPEPAAPEPAAPEPAAPELAASGQVSMYLAGRWYGVALTAEDATGDPVDSLDAALLQNQILGPLLGIDDPRTAARIDFIGGIRGTGELERRVDAAPGSVAFSLAPLAIDDLLTVADANRVLPPKSTWFEPKLRSGLLVHPF